MRYRRAIVTFVFALTTAAALAHAGVAGAFSDAMHAMHGAMPCVSSGCPADGAAEGASTACADYCLSAGVAELPKAPAGGPLLLLVVLAAFAAAALVLTPPAEAAAPFFDVFGRQRVKSALATIVLRN